MATSSLGRCFGPRFLVVRAARGADAHSPGEEEGAEGARVALVLEEERGHGALGPALHVVREGAERNAVGMQKGPREDHPRRAQTHRAQVGHLRDHLRRARRGAVSTDWTRKGKGKSEAGVPAIS